jgi:hypothetical protein
VKVFRTAAGVLALVMCIVSVNAAARAQEAAPLLRQMAGTWDVVQRMWPGPNGAPMVLPAATAERHLLGPLLLQETMTAAPGAKPGFTRIANVGYNAVARQFEYYSWDSRAPQMMTEKSRPVLASSGMGEGAIALQGGTFVAPQWGQMKNMAFRYRLALGPIQNNRQIVRLYITPQSGTNTSEFLAFEYVYTKHH